jgi:prefoldin subunit 5
MEQVFLTKEEIENLQVAQQKESNLINQLGQIEYQIQLLQFQKETIKQSISKFQSENLTVGKELQDKYGDGSINIETGEFIKSN